MGVLSKGHLIEAERADLVGEYIGHTAQKTRDLIKKDTWRHSIYRRSLLIGEGWRERFR